MRVESLFLDEAGLLKAGQNIVIITFLTAYTTRYGLMLTVYLLMNDMTSLWPETEFYFLEYRGEHDNGRRCPGFELRTSMVPLWELKRISMAWEFDKRGRRVADIDIIVYHHGQLVKVSRSNVNTALEMR